MSLYFRAKLLGDFYDSSQHRAINLSAGLTAGLPWMLSLFVLGFALIPADPRPFEYFKVEYIYAAKITAAVGALIISVWVHGYARRKSTELFRVLIEQRNVAYNNYLKKLTRNQLELCIRMASADPESFKMIELELCNRTPTLGHSPKLNSPLAGIRGSVLRLLGIEFLF